MAGQEVVDDRALASGSRRRFGARAFALAGGALAAGAVAIAVASPRRLVDLLTPASGFVRTEGIAYGADARQRLDVYRPRPAAAAGGTIVVFLYGGSWQHGERGLYGFVGEAFASRGHTTVIPDYRTWPEVAFPGFVDDAAAAVAWARAHAAELGGDPDRIVVAGHSAGAHIAALLALDRRYLAAANAPDAVSAMVGLAGPYDFLPTQDPALLRIFGDDPATQPIHYARADAPPLWLAHGTADTTVEPGNSVRLAERMHAAGGRATLRLYDGLGHIGLVLRLAALLRPTSSLLDDIETFVHDTQRRDAAIEARRAAL